ncbi:MAG: four helix bundle protein [Flavobacteriales bacterium]|nr:MAG: four helix bundle protein [Flavobacteriales bacterium]
MKETEERIPAKTFEDLVVWQKAHIFVLAVYKLTNDFPKSETYGLSAQFRRAATSIPANISEGFKKKGTNDKVRFMNIAQGSLEECKYYLVLTKDLNYADTTGLREQLDEVGKILQAYMSAIKNSNS